MSKRPYTLLEYLVALENKLKEIKKYVDDNLGTDYSELTSQVNNLENQFNAFKTSISNTVNTNNTTILSKFSDLENQFNTFKTSITNTVNSNNTSLLSKVNSLETQFDSFKTSITSTVNSNKSELLSKLDTLEVEIDDRVTDVENRVTTLENSGGSGGAGGSGVSDGYGEKLLAHYIHQGNPEFRFSSFDYTTCEGTTSSAHGLTEATEVMIVPNDWTLKNRKYNIGSIPIEWVTYDNIIKLVPVDDITLRVTKKDGTTLLPVDIGVSANQSVDYTKFHFEQVTPWTITNLPKSTNYFRILIKGFIKSNTYRYLMWKIKDNKNNEVMQPYLPLYGLIPPSVGTPKPYNANFGVEDIIYDFRDDLIYFDCKCYCEGRRGNVANVVWDLEKETKLYFVNIEGNNGKLSSIGNYNANYAFNSNGTHVYIYDLGGTL